MKSAALAAALFLGLSGCVTSGTCRGRVSNARAEEFNRSINSFVEIGKELKAKTERLRKFNQVDEAGRLRPLEAE